MRLRKTSVWVKILILVFVVYAVISLVDLQDRVTAANAEVAELEEQVLFAEQEKALMEQELDELGSDRSVMKIARARLGMVEVGEIVFYDADAE